MKRLRKGGQTEIKEATQGGLFEVMRYFIYVILYIQIESKSFAISKQSTCYQNQKRAGKKCSTCPMY